MKLADVLFFAIRHGKTNGNEKKIYRGWSNAPDAQLNDEGKKGAQEAAKYLVSIGAPIKLIITDSLDRVQETAEIIAQSFPGVDVQVVRALHPLDVGDWTLKPKADHPVEPYLEDPSKRIPGGDTVAEFNQRQSGIWEVILNLAEDLPGGQIVVVIHGSNVAYLNNHVFDGTKTKIGYEGLVDPAGVIAATDTGLVPLTNVREKKDQKEKPEKEATYPADHQPGMKVPKGGSMCANCEYLKDAQKRICGNEFFIKWNGSEIIPGKVDEYCSDWYEPK